MDRLLGSWRAEAAGTAHLIAAVDEPIDSLRPHPEVAGELLDRYATTTFAVVRRLEGATLHVSVLFRGGGFAEVPGIVLGPGSIGIRARRHWELGPDPPCRH